MPQVSSLISEEPNRRNYEDLTIVLAIGQRSFLLNPAHRLHGPGRASCPAWDFECAIKTAFNPPNFRAQRYFWAHKPQYHPNVRPLPTRW